jgi:putative hydrolase of HD superfamily
MDSRTILTVIEELNVLKNIRRAGWAIRGIKDCESVAEHVWRMSTLAMMLADVLAEQGVDLDADKVTRMALVHEMGEARIGDIPYPAMRHISGELKYAAEHDAVRTILEGMGPVGQRYVMLWEEFEEGQTLEAKIVKAADKLEMMIQAAEYEQIGYTSLDDFWTNPENAKDFEVHELVWGIIDFLVERRNGA